MSLDLPIVNRVAQSGLVTLNLEELYQPGPRSVVDLAEVLFMGQILREKDLREWVAAHDWAQYTGHQVAVFCSVDAVVPTWAYMLVAIAVAPYAANVAYGPPETLEAVLMARALATFDFAPFVGKRVVVKGCADVPVPTHAYAEVAARLVPIAKSVMYGEPCSTVPLYKRKDPNPLPFETPLLVP